MAEQENKKYAIVGNFGKPFGVRGEIKVHSGTTPQEAILSYSPWYMETRNGWQEVSIEESRNLTTTVIVRIEGITNPEDAKQYSGKKIAINKDLLPKLDTDEYYWSELEGLTVTNQQGITLGTVAYLMETGANDVIVVKSHRKHLIPFIRGIYVIKIDLSAKTILVDWNEDF